MRILAIIIGLILICSCNSVSENSNEEYKCFRWVIFKDLYHVRKTFTWHEPQYEYYAGYVTTDGVQNGFVYGHKDNVSNLYTFAIVYKGNDNHAQLFQFGEDGNGTQVGIKFGTNHTSRYEPSTAKFQWIKCNYNSEQQPITAARQITHRDVIVYPKNDFRCIRSTVYIQEKWLFKPTIELDRSIVLFGYTVLNSKIGQHLAGLIDKSSGIHTLFTMYHIGTTAGRMFVFRKNLPAFGMNYVALFTQEGSYFEMPDKPFFSVCEDK